MNQNGAWTIPSHYDYPADGAEKLATTAAALIALTKRRRGERQRGRPRALRRIDPLDGAVATAKGRGTRVVVRGGDAAVLADIIIGATVQGRDQMRYVRVPGQTRTYVSRVGGLSVSAKVDDWIERDLLRHRDEMKASRFAIRRRRRTRNVADGERLVLRRQKLDVWTLAGLAAGERINPFPMNLLVTTLDDLVIADVRPKPPAWLPRSPARAARGCRPPTRPTSR